MKRKSIGKRLRFEIFKRDRFTCQYCGQKPPTIVLHLDHILAVANGGTNEEINLITSCQDCNLGKSAKPLGVVIDPVIDRLKQEVEKMEQMRQQNEFLIELKKAKNQEFKEVSDLLVSAMGKDREWWHIDGDLANAVCKFLGRLPKLEIIEAVEIADEKIGFKEREDDAVQYFYGICWRKINGDMPKWKK